MGARRAIGVDVDPMAVTSASYNASLNMIEDHRFQVFLSDINGGDPVPPGAAYRPVYDNSMDENMDEQRGPDFDVVVANILANPLVELSNLIASYARPGAMVGLSGILVEQVCICSLPGHASHYCISYLSWILAWILADECRSFSKSHSRIFFVMVAGGACPEYLCTIPRQYSAIPGQWLGLYHWHKENNQ